MHHRRKDRGIAVSKIRNVLAMLIVLAAIVAAGPSPALAARPLCGTGYVCAYDNLDGSSRLFKLYWSNWAQSLCYDLGRYGGKISYIVNDSDHYFEISKTRSCSGEIAPIYPYSFGPMNSDWDNAGWSTYRLY